MQNHYIQIKPTELVENKNYVYEFNEDGKLTCFDQYDDPVSGFVRYEDDIYYMDKEGIMMTGWVKSEGNWYYFYDEDYIIEHKLEDEVRPGTMAVDTTIDNYKVNSEGEMVKATW